MGDNNLQDDFERAGSNPLGDSWTTTYRGHGMGMSESSGELEQWRWDRNPVGGHSLTLQLADEAKAFASPPKIYFSNGRSMTLNDTCAACGKRWQKRHIAVSHDGAPFRHRDCADPTGEAED